MAGEIKISRKTSIRINYFFDQVLPPFLRDSRWFMWLPMKLIFGKKIGIFMDFKNNVFTMNDEQFSELYESTADVTELQGDSDLNDECLEAIL